MVAEAKSQGDREPRAEQNKDAHATVEANIAANVTSASPERDAPAGTAAPPVAAGEAFRANVEPVVAAPGVQPVQAAPPVRVVPLPANTGTAGLLGQSPMRATLALATLAVLLAASARELTRVK